MNRTWIIAGAVWGISSAALAHEEQAIQQEATSRSLWVVTSPGDVNAQGTTRFASASVSTTELGPVRVAGPDVGFREQPLIGIRTASVGLGSVHWALEAPLGSGRIRLLQSGDGRLALFHSARGGYPYVPDRSNPLALCGSQSAIGSFFGIGFGETLSFGILGEAQDDPFHFRWASGLHAGTGCLGHPPVWTSSETVGAEVRLALSPHALLKATALREAQRVTYSLGDDAYGLLSGQDTSLRLSLQVSL